MNEKLYTIEIKAGALTPFDWALANGQFPELGAPTPAPRIVCGNVIGHTPQALTYTEGEAIVAYLPHNLGIALQEPTPRQFVMQIPESFAVKKPAEVSFELAAAGVATGVQALTALHYNLGILEGQTLLIVGAQDSVAAQIAQNMGVHVLQAGENQSIHLQELPGTVLQETGGLGVHHILDFSESHSYSLKRALLACLRPRGC